MTTIHETDRFSQLTAAAKELTGSGIPVLPIKSRAKTPIPNPDGGSWWIIDDPDDVTLVFTEHPEANLAMVCGRAKESPVLLVDIDGPSGLAKAQELGVSSSSDCWVQRTGRGGWHIAYYADSELELHRRVKPQGVDLDLVVDGYALVEPSVTTGPYRWEPGHSPTDIPLADLASPPATLVEWWQAVQAATPTTPHSESGGAIPSGQRNSRLTSLGGKLRRLGLGQEAIFAALLAENSERSSPPLPEGEVRAIAKSVSRYPDGGAAKRGPVVVRVREPHHG